MAADSSPDGSALGRAAAAWASEHWMRVDGWQIRHREAGRGPAVVLVHGLGVSADYWYRNGPPLAAAGFRVLAPDLPGFGRSRGEEAALSISEQVLALLGWLDVVGLEAAVFIGHSLSCQVVLELAACHPERVRGLVLVGPTGDPRPHRLLHQVWALLRDIPRESFHLAVMVGHAYLRAGVARVWRTWRDAGRENPMPLLPLVRAPALVVAGTRDPVVRPDFAEALARGLSRGKLAWIRGGAHAVIFTSAAEFNRVVLEFLGEVGSGGSSLVGPRPAEG